MKKTTIIEDLGLGSQIVFEVNSLDERGKKIFKYLGEDIKCAVAEFEEEGFSGFYVVRTVCESDTIVGTYQSIIEKGKKLLGSGWNEVSCPVCKHRLSNKLGRGNIDKTKIKVIRGTDRDGDLVELLKKYDEAEKRGLITGEEIDEGLKMGLL